MPVEITPLHDRVVVKRKDMLAKTEGGIIIPEQAREKPIEATVIAVGCGRFTDAGTVIPLGVKPGDSVLISRFGGTNLTIEGEDVTILREEEILCVIPSAA